MSKKRVRRNYRDTVFRLIFKEKKELLNLYEHQSSVNPNMPLRDLFYVSKVLQNIVKDENLYGSKLIKIPAPKFVIFYNGDKEMPEQSVYRLSDMYEKSVDELELELVVRVLNINPGKNETLLQSCRMLKEYMLYTTKVRENLATMDIETAVDEAVKECIAEGILAEFLKKNRAEVIAVSIFEYNEEEHIKSIREEGIEQGMESKGMQVFLNMLARGFTTQEAQEIAELSDELVERALIKTSEKQ